MDSFLPTDQVSTETGQVQYAVLAVDRSGRGWGYVYCSGGDCHMLNSSQHGSFKDVQYKRRALNLCRQNVRDNVPAEKPSCAIYAIKDKIVWEGRFPWK